jgi:hypothetical protein
MLLDARITDYLESSGLRSMYQGGFRPHRGTTEQVFVLNHLTDAARQRRAPLYCAFVDFRKAFDTVRHQHLWERLDAYGISGPIQACIRSLYAQSEVAVNVNGEQSDFVRVLVGVRQGDPLSPTLFGLFIEVLEQYVRRAVGPEWQGRVPAVLRTAVYMLMYADDVVLLANDPATLQRQLDALAQFCTDWDMAVNLAKTKVLVYDSGTRGGRAATVPQHTWAFQGQPVEQVQQYKYLGLIFDATRGFSTAPAQLAAAGRRALGAAQGMCANSDITDPSIRLHLWQQLVLPVVSYGCEVWGAQHQHFTELSYFSDNPGEDVHLDFLRWYTGAGSKAHKRVILQAANRLPALQHWLQRSLQLWNKLAAADPDSWLAHQAFVENVQMWHGGSDDCWAARLISHLQHLDILPADTVQLWQRRFDPAAVEASMDYITTANWDIMGGLEPYRVMCQAPGGANGLTMVCFAQHFAALHAGLGRQVYHNIPAWQWRPIMQLVTGRLLLRCVTSRWKGPQRTSGACPCSACSGALEDPAHYVLECAGLTDLRARYPAVVAAASAVAVVGAQAALRALVVPQNFAELANFLVLAKRRRFAVDGAARMQAAAEAAAHPSGGST